MKVKKLSSGYLLRMNDSEFAALQYVVEFGVGPLVGRIDSLRKDSPTGEITRGLRTLHLTVDEDRRGHIVSGSGDF